MKAVRWHAARDVRVEDLPDLGEPEPGWVRIRVEACGICGTDVEEYERGPVIVSHTPVVLGHEAAGVIEAVGEGVRLRVGDRVAVEGNMVCGECAWCRAGEPNLCAHNRQLGLGADGGLATHMLAPAAVCAAVPASVRPEHAALAEPVSVAVRAVRRGGVEPGSTVAIVGAGTVGLLLLQVARHAGASTVVVLERMEARRRLALELGADRATDLPGEERFDVVFESAGNPAAAQTAVALTRRGGCAVLLGVVDEDLTLSMLDLLLGEKTVLTSLSHVFDPDFTTAVALIAEGVLVLDPLITDRVGLEDAVTRGLAVLASEPADHLKIMVIPGT